MFIHTSGQIVGTVGEFWSQTTLSYTYFILFLGTIYWITCMEISLEVHRNRNKPYIKHPAYHRITELS